MSKMCPIVNAKVVYLECLECEDRVCECSNDNPQEVIDRDSSKNSLNTKSCSNNRQLNIKK